MTTDGSLPPLIDTDIAIRSLKKIARPQLLSFIFDMIVISMPADYRSNYFTDFLHASMR